MGLSEEKDQPTYANIRDYVQRTHGMKVSSLYVAQMKAECEAMSPSVIGETTTSEAPVETEIDEAFMSSVRFGFHRSFLFAFEIGCRR